MYNSIKNEGGVVVLVLSTLSDHALYLYQVLSKYLIGFQKYGPDQWVDNRVDTEICKGA